MNWNAASVLDICFRALRENDDIPFGHQAKLKSLVAERNSEPVALKLANVIHTQPSVLEGDWYSSMREMLNSSSGSHSLLRNLLCLLVSVQPT